MISRTQIGLLVAACLFVLGIALQKIQIQPMSAAYSQVQPNASPVPNASGPNAPTPNVPIPPPPPAVNDPQTLMPPLLTNQDFIYDPSGKRDPFKAFITDFQDTIANSATDKPATGEKESVENYDLGQLKLVGVLWDVPIPKAMIQSPSGKVFLIKKQSKIGRNKGFVGVIRESEIVVFELSQDGKTPSTRLMSLQK